MSPLDGAVIPIVAGVAISMAGIALLVTRRGRPGGRLAPTGAERAIEAADDEVTAALQRRTLRRGRMRVEDEPKESSGRSAPRRGSG